ncbi:uncharacterized protein LOC125145856 isoform X2 [Tachysurus fulvidraco]|uniref:uncharacterized protein LOC125145856 isoform X2 n=1 Tax=Tachysurus fulvidraco TaxID=1234273 RepID=UPI001FEE3E12|nr:uncharacterized protein LOC125145856 isoform X2 [Tachysurus fulvidraco]
MCTYLGDKFTSLHWSHPVYVFFVFCKFTKCEPNMWFFIVIVLLLFPFSLQEECLHTLLMSHNGYVNVTLGQHFNLTCTFTCSTVADRVQMLKGHWLLTELSLSRDYPESKHTIVLFLLISAVQRNDAGQYMCQNDQQELLSSATLKIVDKDEYMVTDKDNITETPISEVKSTCSTTVSWNAPLWYLLCKMVLFLICSLIVVLKKACSNP